MTLNLAHQHLRWPSRDQVLNPPGAGPRVLVDLARRKIGGALLRDSSVRGVEVGILCANPHGDSMEAPIAVVCEFQQQASQDVLRHAHNLAWNFAQTPMLVTVEPTVVRAWSCCEAPEDKSSLLASRAVGPELRLPDSGRGFASDQAARAFHWIELVSGRFFVTHEDRFQRDGRADRLMLANLKTLRDRLCNDKEDPSEDALSKDVCHDLLARLIFVQFLFHRKDNAGIAALHEGVLEKWSDEGVLSKKYATLAEILRNHKDTYALFEWLNVRFNGDLFSGEGETPEQRTAARRKEKRLVKASHLRTLADFVSGEMDMGKGQRCLWPQYAFDVIPLDFMSSIYEAFIREDEEAKKLAEKHGEGQPTKPRRPSKKGVVYTPGFLVDFMLDTVLPWDSHEWNVSVCDPACGSGIYLVKAYQRLIHRWRIANNWQKPTVAVLREILANNLFGVDVNEHAVRVASLSLYLTMCDEIEPRYYFRTVKFPALRHKRLRHADFFREDVAGLRSGEKQGQYDLVVGNPPWGKNTAGDLAKQWAGNHDWPLAYGSVGPLFLAKAAKLARKQGCVSLLQSNSVLVNRLKAPKHFRKRFFASYDVDEVVNLSALRLDLFEEAIGPACIVTFSPRQPRRDVFSYVSPKPRRTAEDEYSVVIEPHDVTEIRREDASENPNVWAALMWGSQRDMVLIDRLSAFQNLEKLHKRGVVKKREGGIRGDRKKEQKDLLKRRILKESSFPERTFLQLQASRLPRNDDPFTHSKDSTKLEAFCIPQLIVKKGWQVGTARFRAALVVADETGKGILCNSSYLSIHEPDTPNAWREAACLALNSKLAVYWLFLTSGRFATYLPEIKVNQMLTVPIPKARPGLLEGLHSFDDIDLRVRELFALKESEWILVEDLLEYALPDLHDPKRSKARLPTNASDADAAGTQREEYLLAYCNCFARVLRAGFGADKNVVVRIFHQPQTEALPVRLVAIHLGWPTRSKPIIEQMGSQDLIDRLLQLDEKLLRADKGNHGGVFHQRVARVYESFKIDGKSIPTVYLVKPDERRYWTRSMAMRDADEVAADIMIAGTGGQVREKRQSRGEVG